ncbi:MAG: histidinol dehydrogenase, partial [Chloroflexota bacterium]
IEVVRRFHEAQLPHPEPVETLPGVVAWREWRPIGRAGLYAPGGRGPYPSSVVMLGIPAALASCGQVILCTPPDSHGNVPTATLAAADLVGIERIFKLGGAQAIAAMAFGTESVPKVDKLFGAGNPYVTAAKLLAFPGCALDAPAGPSELLILADELAEPDWIAADMLSGAEHGPDSAAVLVTPSAALGRKVSAALEKQLKALPRKEVALQALTSRGLIVVTSSIVRAIDFVERYAPEHLEIVTADPRAVLDRVSNAASVFLGPHSANAAGDYATGTNHVLPTAGYARNYSAVSVESFGRLMQCQELTGAGLRSLVTTVAALARSEGLEGHARAVELRVEAWQTPKRRRRTRKVREPRSPNGARRPLLY